MNSGANGAEKIFSFEKGELFFFSTKYMANDDCSESPQRAGSRNPIFIFCQILGPDHLRGPGVGHVGLTALVLCFVLRFVGMGLTLILVRLGSSLGVGGGGGGLHLMLKLGYCYKSSALGKHSPRQDVSP